MGDQKYLDSWPTRFQGVHVLQHVGAGVAPWNFANYQIAEKAGRLTIDGVPLIFYHFHGFRFRSDGRNVAMPEMYLSDAVLPDAIYRQYTTALNAAAVSVRRLEPRFNSGVELTESSAGSAEVVNKFYWAVPEWCRVAARRIVPQAVRAQVLRLLGREDHRGRSL